MPSNGRPLEEEEKEEEEDNSFPLCALVFEHILMYTSLAHFYGCLDYLFLSLAFTFNGRHA
jgi:hypothetical protein